MRLGEFELNQIYTGDARILAEGIPDESVDLIFTDPVYDRIDDYRWLAEIATRILKMGGKVLSWQATPLLAKIIKVMEPPLQYVWTMHMQKYGPCYPGKSGICVITQCLWFDKDGTSKTRHKIADWYGAAQGGHRGGEYKWSKPESVITHWLDAFCPLNGIVADPFGGLGTVPAVCKMLNRNYLAFEIDPEVAERARERVANTQPPLFVPQPQQMEMGG